MSEVGRFEGSGSARADEEPVAPDPYEVSAYQLGAYLPERIAEEGFGGRTLLKLAARRLLARLGIRPRESDEEAIVAYFSGIAVLDRPGQHKGGLAGGSDFPRVLNELGVGRRRRVHEFCSGPGYIGYALLAAGWCEELTLSDIDPGAIATARRTAELNRVEDRVRAYESDVLSQIPATERWDIVVANPPHFLPDPDEPPSIQRFDADWDVHRRFYASVARYMEPGGVVVMLENEHGSDPELFEQMIVEGGGRLRANHPGVDVRGCPTGVYFQVSEW